MGSVHVAALLAFRVTAMLWVAPVFSSRAVSGRLKVAMLGLFTIVLLPVAGTTAGAPSLNVASIFGEIVIGLTIGLGAAVMVGAAEVAGDVLAIQTGLSGAAVVDPNSGSQLAAVGQFMGLVATTIFLVLGGHHLVLQAVAASFDVLPAGAGIRVQAGFDEAVVIGTTLFRLGAQLAAPVIGALLLSNAALGVLARTVPQLNVLMVAFPVQIALGLMVLGLSLPMVATTLSGWPEVYESLITRILGGLGGMAGRG